MLGYSDPNRGVSQSELANEARYLINKRLARNLDTDLNYISFY